MAAGPGRRATDGEALAVRAACETAHDGLVRWFGPAGTRALFMRAIADAQTDHPALERIRTNYEQTGALGNALTSLAESNDAEVAGAMRAVLIAVLDLLGRLVGHDMAERIVEPQGDSGAPQDKRS